MKRLISLSILVVLITLAANAQTTNPKFETTVHDFGTVAESNGIITATFEFVNEGNTPLVIKGVSASCGCAIPEWTQKPVAPKEKGVIKVSYNPKGRPGTFVKSITVRTNASEQPVILKIKGNVTPSAK